MSGDPLICSFDVSVSRGCAPGCSGDQPHTVLPPFYPDSASSFVSQKEAKTFFEKLDKIFQETGLSLKWLIFANLALMIVPLVIIVILIVTKVLEGIGLAVLVIVPLALIFLPFLSFIGYRLLAMNKRKTRIMEELDNWNTNEGTSRGIYFALGGEDGRNGPSDDDFWLGIYPRTLRQGNTVTAVIQTNPKIHLYVNPTARKEYCSKAGLEFYLPPQYIPVQVPGAVAYTMNNV